MPENSSIITHKLTRKASPREEQEPNCKGVDQVHLSPQEQLTSHKVKMRQDDRTPAQSQRTSGGDIAPMLSSIKDKANQAVKSAKDIVTSALQSIEGDDDDTTPSTGGVTGGGDSKKETNTTKQDTPPQPKSENVKKDGDKPSRHATENDPYSPPTFPPTLNEAIKEAQEDPPRGHNGPKRKKSSSSSSSPVENKSKL